MNFRKLDVLYVVLSLIVVTLPFSRASAAWHDESIDLVIPDFILQHQADRIEDPDKLLAFLDTEFERYLFVAELISSLQLQSENSEVAEYAENFYLDLYSSIRFDQLRIAISDTDMSSSFGVVFHTPSFVYVFTG